MTTREYRYLDVISVVFVVVLLISNITAIKPLRLPEWFPFAMDGGNLLFPISYIFGDVLVEVYGYARARRVIWLGFAINALASIVFGIVAAWPAAPGWELEDAFVSILGQVPRVVIASLIAFWCGSFANSYIMAKMKLLTKGRWLWTRTVGSTVIGQLVDSLLFTVVGFAGLWSGSLMLSVIAGNYLFKVAYEALATPITYAVVGFLKKAEETDAYDRDTNFNPFRMGV